MNNLPIISEAQLLAMPDDQYMNPQQLAFFRSLLLNQQQEVTQHLEALRLAISEPAEQGDDTDKASLEEEKALLLRQADRETRLLSKILHSLEQIEKGAYGFCRETGDPIGLQRLLLRPTAELSLEAKQLQEQKEQQFAHNRG
ncbi:TraR/DksA C4-type zinc finger protein [Marinospirillum alkaliphilum]|uniref:Transcriptional regulator, TraR/DksA family n=1 Tax=Marinospirillum alkaliphilum DSM 21637 TaxID=1122209 RepID=A0A1K1ZXC2_9GAMM|nr:TraR/DksA C4-type zinc finger protein [Marinospirillum alkaliphilum]SFX78292.1 transcriptional regulator, TraR/DksA family [Marinospirillum alkaliphilum DSM 21637]